MLFGLHGTMVTFQHLMDKLLIPHQNYAMAYIDDVIIFSDSWQQHLKDPRSVLEDLRATGTQKCPTQKMPIRPEGN